MTRANESEPLAALRDGVLQTVFFLCLKSYVGNIAHLKHPRFIQSLDGSRGELWPDKCLQSENYISIYSVFVFKK